MVIDTLKCVGCSDCVVACQTENNVPIGYCRDWITETVDGAYPNVELELKSERCNHCENAPDSAAGQGERHQAPSDTLQRCSRRPGH